MSEVLEVYDQSARCLRMFPMELINLLGRFDFPFLGSYIFHYFSMIFQTPAKLNSIKREVSLSFVLLKKLNRLEKYRLKNARETLQAKKSKVDSFNLQLQNLKYEIFHLKKEVVKCLQFK
jgi:Fms-interacting protein.